MTFNYFSRNGVSATEHGGCLFHFSLCQCAPYGGGTDFHARRREIFRSPYHTNAHAFAQRTVMFERFVLVVPYGMVVAHDKDFDVEAVKEIFAHEILCRKHGKGFGEIKQGAEINALAFDERKTLVGGGQKRRLALGTQHGKRMLGKSNRHGGKISRTSHCFYVFKQEAMTEMHTVEKTYGSRRSFGGTRVVFSQNFHCFCALPKSSSQSPPPLDR